MSWSDCPKCWDTPCTCGYEYKDWSMKRKWDLITAIAGGKNMVELFVKSFFAERPKDDPAVLKAKIKELEERIKKLEVMDQNVKVGDHYRSPEGRVCVVLLGFEFPEPESPGVFIEWVDTGLAKWVDPLAFQLFHLIEAKDAAKAWGALRAIQLLLDDEEEDDYGAVEDQIRHLLAEAFKDVS